MAAKGCPLVVISHHPDDFGPESRRRRFDDRAKLLVRIWFTLIGEVASEDDGLGPARGRLELIEELAKVSLAVDATIELAIGEMAVRTKQVRVAEMEQEVVRPRMFGDSDGHGPSIRVVLHRVC
jgi:hypothetical protein